MAAQLMKRYHVQCYCQNAVALDWRIETRQDAEKELERMGWTIANSEWTCPEEKHEKALQAQAIAAKWQAERTNAT